MKYLKYIFIPVSRLMFGSKTDYRDIFTFVLARDLNLIEENTGIFTN